MGDSGATLALWNESDLCALLALDEVGPLRYRNRHGDANLNGRAYGGQILGQAMMAASLNVDERRAATAMQLLFLQGTVPDQPVDFEVAALQDGKRFSSRHVRATQQGDRVVLDAHVTFAMSSPAPAHTTASSATESMPEALPALPEMPWAWEEGLRRLGGYSLREKACMDFRVPDIERQVAPDAAQPRLRFWLKARHKLPASPAVHAAAFAYLSDWWLNFSSLGMHVRDLQSRDRLYIASLNHNIWFHRQVIADQWLHFDSESPCAHGGRGLSIARVHDQQGQMVATVTQECLMAYAGNGTA